MKPHELKPAEGAVKRRKRVGRGDGSGKGKAVEFAQIAKKLKTLSEKDFFVI